MVKVPLSYSFLERRDARRKFSESLGAGASLAPRTRQRISLGSENDWKFRLRSCQSWKASSLSLEVVVPTSINKYRMRYVGLGRGNLRSHFVFRPRHAPEWLRARFLPVAFLANEEELTGKTFTTSLNTTNPITYVKFIFLRTSPLRGRRCLSTRERTSFVAVPQTENGRVLSWRAGNLPSFAFCHVSQTFEELFHRAFHDWTRSG